MGLLTLLVRGQTFAAPLADRTLGLYLHVAAEMLRGTLPYVGTWEYKPPGAFLPYALALLLTHSFPAAAIVVGFAAVFATAVLVLVVAQRLDPEHGRTAGRWACILYVLMSPEDDALTGDVELCIAPFALAALALLLQARSFDARRCLVFGLLAAGALQMKLTALPTCCFLLGALAFSGGRKAAASLRFALLGFVLPICIEIAVYAQAGHLRELYDANVGATWRRLLFRPGEHAHGGDALVQQFRVLAPALQAALAGLLFPVRRRIALLWALLAVQACALVLTGEYDYRQFLPLVPIVALLGGFGLDALLRRVPRPRAFAALAVLISLGLHDYYAVAQSLRYAYHHAVLREAAWHEDAVSRMAEELPPLLHGERSVFLVNASPVLYDMLKAQPPTRYSFTQNLLDRSKWSMLGFNGEDEMLRVLARHPRYVALTAMENAEFDPQAVQTVRKLVARAYRPLGSIAGGLGDGGELFDARRALGVSERNKRPGRQGRQRRCAGNI